MEQLLPLPLFCFGLNFEKIAKNHHFLRSQKFKYLGTTVMDLDDFFFVAFR